LRIFGRRFADFDDLDRASTQAFIERDIAISILIELGQDRKNGEILVPNRLADNVAQMGGSLRLGESLTARGKKQGTNQRGEYEAAHGNTPSGPERISRQRGRENANPSSTA
jgi:hypothetical protein